jgi:hypothetical protein
MDKITQYYLLCSTVTPKKHFAAAVINTIFTKKEVKLLFRELDGNWIANESIIGGVDDIDLSTSHDKDAIPFIANRPVLVFLTH